MMATPTFKMFWQTMMLAGLVVLVASTEMNGTSTASPKVKITTTSSTEPPSTTPQPPPQLSPVMDLFQAPLAAFKQKTEGKNDVEMGRDESTASTPAPANIFFKAGNSLGTAASSITGWFNNRMIPPALRTSTSTTEAPEVLAIIPNQQVKRRIIVATENGRRPQANRQGLVMNDSEDSEDDEEESNDNDDIEDNFNSNFGIDAEDDEDDYETQQKRNALRKNQKRPHNRRQYFYIEEELAENDDFDYDIQSPVIKPQRKQQNSPSKRRKTPPKKKQQIKRKPLRKGQNPQRVQIVQSRPSQTQINRKRRPGAAFELVPISQNQAMNSIQLTKPSSGTQNNQQGSISQFFSIPWSRLGFARPPKESTPNEQQSKPIIVRIPQQNIKRQRRPSKKPGQINKNPKRKSKPLRAQSQNLSQKQSPVFSILTEEQIREIFKNQLNAPLKTSSLTSNLPVTLDSKKKPPKKENEATPSNNDNDNETEAMEKPQSDSEVGNNEEDTNSYIIVGPADEEDDKEIDVNLYRQYTSNNRRAFQRGSASAKSNRNWKIEEDYDE